MTARRSPSDLRAALAQTIVGQDSVIEALLLALLSNGHVLLEGPPGLAKTLACRSLAAALEGEFKRIQFTPDLLPSDIVGTRIFDQRESSFATVLGPIFANVVLADEINRAPAKVQSALLEAMQERQVTIGPASHPLPDPFVVMATMNPLDSEGTYALPIAQMDRFLMKINVGYPSRDEEMQILERFAMSDTQPVYAVATLDDIREWRATAHAVHIDEKLKRYIVQPGRRDARCRQRERSRRRERFAAGLRGDRLRCEPPRDIGIGVPRPRPGFLERTRLCAPRRRSRDRGGGTAASHRIQLPPCHGERERRCGNRGHDCRHPRAVTLREALLRLAGARATLEPARRRSIAATAMSSSSCAHTLRATTFAESIGHRPRAPESFKRASFWKTSR